MHRSIVPIALAILATLVAAACPPAAAETFGESISVTEVEIPVTVLRDNEPVRSLTRDDFVVTDDGAPREIIGFRVIDLSSVAGDQAGDRAAEESPAEPPPTASAPAGGRQILVLVNALYSRNHQLQRALDGVQQMVAEDLHPSDRVAVAYLSAYGARLLLGFTRDREAIGAALGAVDSILSRKPAQMQEALGRLARAEIGGVQTNAGLLSSRLGPAASVAVMTGLEQEDGPSVGLPYGPGGMFSGVYFSDRSSPSKDPVERSLVNIDPFDIGKDLAKASYSSGIRTLSLEMQRLLTMLRDVPSPKQVLFLSEGFGSEALRSFDSKERPLILRALDDLAGELRRTGWTLHAIDVGGIPNAFVRGGYRADALLRLAHQTGGFLFENYNRIGLATAKLAHRTSITYVLTIRPEGLQPDGRLHQLDVRLRDGLAPAKLSHRQAYYAPKPPGERTLLERQLDQAELLLGGQQIHDLDARVLVRSLPLAGSLAAVPVVIELSAESLRSLLAAPNPARRIGLDLQIYAVAADGGVEDLWLRKLGLDLDRVGSLLEHGGFRILGGLELPAGEYRIRVLVRAAPGDRVSLTTEPVTVAPAGGTGSVLAMDPVLVDRSGGWLELASVPPNAASAAGRLLAFDRDGERPLVPAVEPSVAQGDELDLVVIASGDRGAELTARVVAPDGDARGGGVHVPVIRLVERAATASPDAPGAGLSRYLARFTTAGLAPGRYGLEVRAAGGSGGGGESRTLYFDVHPE